MSSTDHCRKHPHETAEATCPECSYAYCAACVVYVQGPSRPPLCLECALSRAGVRSAGARKRSWSQRRREAKLRKAAAKGLEVARRAANEAAIETEGEPLEFDPTLLERERRSWSSAEGDWSPDR